MRVLVLARCCFLRPSFTGVFYSGQLMKRFSLIAFSSVMPIALADFSSRLLQLFIKCLWMMICIGYAGFYLTFTMRLMDCTAHKNPKWKNKHKFRLS